MNLHNLSRHLGRCPRPGFPELSHHFILKMCIRSLKKKERTNRYTWLIMFQALCAFHFVCSHEGQNNVSEQDIISTPIFQIRKLRHRKVEELV